MKVNKRDIDIRVSIIPMIHGEAVVLRILDSGGQVLSIDKLGMSPRDNKLFMRVLDMPHGIILVTGPTGSGKTTTLYTSLAKINDVERKIITIEDPVEYQLKGVNQIQVNTKAGLTFAAGLRAILRHDPDVVLVGEIRDYETAEIAVQASLTGHLVFSTLHTNDAPGAATRLVDMGVEPYLVASSLETVIAQRLVRVICKNCKQPLPDAEYRQAKEEYGDLVPEMMFHGAGLPRLPGHRIPRPARRVRNDDDDRRSQVALPPAGAGIRASQDFVRPGHEEPPRRRLETDPRRRDDPQGSRSEHQG